MELFLSDNDGQVGYPFFHRNNTSISFHLKFPNKRLRAFSKKHTTFLKRGRMVVFELLLNRCWKQCIHPKIDTVVFKKTLDVFEKTFDVSKKTLDVFFKTTVCVKTYLGDAVKTTFK